MVQAPDRAGAHHRHWACPEKIDGWQIAESCREHDPHLPVICATGFSPVKPRPVAGSLMLQKPYHPDDIVKAVKDVTAAKRGVN
ncbi:hypothetical protein [Bradyrhizobium sp.]|uniref:hypothetical protein n=1 Tax=Bradyrhizobium sp. TaxID=376 RepID=UPI0039E3FFA1